MDAEYIRIDNCKNCKGVGWVILSGHTELFSGGSVYLEPCGICNKKLLSTFKRSANKVSSPLSNS